MADRLNTRLQGQVRNGGHSGKFKDQSINLFNISVIQCQLLLKLADHSAFQAKQTLMPNQLL